MREIWGEAGRLLSIELTREEMRELLAFEATLACVRPSLRPAFLEALARNYGIPAGDLAPFLKKRMLNREDVWQLQVLKRTAERNRRAVEIVSDLRRLEAELGEDVLEVYVARTRLAPPR